LRAQSSAHRFTSPDWYPGQVIPRHHFARHIDNMLTAGLIEPAREKPAAFLGPPRRHDRGGRPSEQTPRTLILGDRRLSVAEVLDAWLAPDYRYFKLKGADGDTYLVRHDERSNTWELTMFRAERIGG
jgi:hypothetical protein